MPTIPDGTPPGAADEDDFDRRLRELTENAAGPARFREPSAAERARLAQQARRRESRRARKLRWPGPGSGPGRQPAPGRAPIPGRGASPGRARGPRSTVIAVIAVACIGGGVTAVGWLSRRHQTGDAAATKTVTKGPVPSLAPTASVADPFLGTPAASFADGRAGIILPAAHAVGTFSAAQVRAAYVTTRKLLIAAGLNGPTLRGGSPAAFARLLTPQERNYFVRHLDQAGLDRKGLARSTRGWVASFAPGSAALAGNVIKVHGRMSARRAVASHRQVLQIHADYLFVYPVISPGRPATLMRVVLRLGVDVNYAQWTDPGGSLEPWWGYLGGGAAGALCGINDGFIHPAYPASGPGKVTPSGTPVDPYNQAVPPDTWPGCQATTGT
jgi:hypothetical protein